MMRKQLLTTALGIVFLFSPNAYAETSSTDLSKKLDRILETQKKLIQQLDEVKQELYVIKIRATQQ